MIVNGNNKYIVFCISFTMPLYKNVGVVVKSKIKICFMWNMIERLGMVCMVYYIV